MHLRRGATARCRGRGSTSVMPASASSTTTASWYAITPSRRRTIGSPMSRAGVCDRSSPPSSTSSTRSSASRTRRLLGRRAPTAGGSGVPRHVFVVRPAAVGRAPAARAIARDCTCTDRAGPRRRADRARPRAAARRAALHDGLVPVEAEPRARVDELLRPRGLHARASRSSSRKQRAAGAARARRATRAAPTAACPDAPRRSSTARSARTRLYHAAGAWLDRRSRATSRRVVH